MLSELAVGKSEQSKSKQDGPGVISVVWSEDFSVKVILFSTEN